MPRKKAKAKVEKKSTSSRRVKKNKIKTKSRKPQVRRSISLQSAEVVKMQREFLKIEDEITEHIASRAPMIPLAKPQILSRTYFVSNEERLEPIKSSLKRLKRE